MRTLIVAQAVCLAIPAAAMGTAWDEFESGVESSGLLRCCGQAPFLRAHDCQP